MNEFSTDKLASSQSSEPQPVEQRQEGPTCRDCQGVGLISFRNRHVVLCPCHAAVNALEEALRKARALLCCEGDAEEDGEMIVHIDAALLLVGRKDAARSDQARPEAGK